MQKQYAEEDEVMIYPPDGSIAQGRVVNVAKNSSGEKAYLVNVGNYDMRWYDQKRLYIVSSRRGEVIVKRNGNFEKGKLIDAAVNLDGDEIMFVLVGSAEKNDKQWYKPESIFEVEEIETRFGNAKNR